MGNENREWKPTDKAGRLLRGAEFWRRATGIYLSYKATQARAGLMKMSGMDDDKISEVIWKPHNKATGRKMYNLCVDLRGFYLKAGQFMGARADFVPEEICKQLSKLHDKVPPMPKKVVQRILKEELAVDDLYEIFEEIDLDSPLGSASIAQVHRGKLNRVKKNPVCGLLTRLASSDNCLYITEEGEEAWDICNKFGVSFQELKQANKGTDLSRIKPDSVIRVPNGDIGVRKYEKSSNDVMGRLKKRAARRAMLRGEVGDGTVAIKVQYPDANEIMRRDFINIRAWARFLSKTEIQFDMVSAVDELENQIQLEFDFQHEAKVMDSIAMALQPINNRVAIPRSIPGLVTRNILVMSFMDGIPLRDLEARAASLSPRKKKKAKERVLKRLCEAYGRMIFGNGLFQADGHPGNILVQKRAKIALLDYGQSKQLAPQEVYQLSKLIMSLSRNDVTGINRALEDMGIEIMSEDLYTKKRMAVGMFDTTGRVDPFDKNSPLKEARVSSFPPDMFFVLRVVQLLRGMKQGMQVDPDFSSAKLWDKFARDAYKRTRNQTVAPA